MTGRKARIEAARRTVEGERIRWLLGKKGQLTTVGNVFDEKITDARYSFIVQKAAAVELERNLLLTQMEKGPRTVHELHDFTGIAKPEIVRHIIALKKWRLVEQTGMKGQAPQYSAVPGKQSDIGEVS
ncbi:MAG: ArsR family transcriptional regulator [Candidatus Thermoplasmatota archaeon]|nr:ArsR family transcriptional regulator [Candidatus Thermoplasmatota archaeon]